MLTFKARLGKDRLPDLVLSPLDETTVLFSPGAPLHVGEYIVSTVSMGYKGYDFGFHPGKQIVSRILASPADARSAIQVRPVPPYGMRGASSWRIIPATMSIPKITSN
jgi:hypothetical protein